MLKMYRKKILFQFNICPNVNVKCKAQTCDIHHLKNRLV